MMSDSEFAAEVLRLHKLDDALAEQHWWRQFHAAKAEGRMVHARSCLRQLTMLLSALGRERDSLKVAILAAREADAPSAKLLTMLGASLWRYGWSGFAKHFFAAALELPDHDGPVSWHAQARAGIAEIENGAKPRR